MNQDDLYKDGFRSGPLGAVFMFNLWRIFPSGGAWVVFQIIYIISVIFLCLLLTRNRSAEIRLLISFFAISAAPMREHLHNHQISSLVILFCLWPFLIKAQNRFFWLFSTASCAIAIDLKPHLSLIIILALSIYARNIIILVSAGVFLISSHTVISAMVGENITLQYLRFLFDLNRSNDWGESIYLWPLFEKLGVKQSHLHILEYTSILIIVILVLRFAYIRNIQACLIAIALLTYFVSYAHFYDLILLSILATIAAVSARNARSILFMSFAIMPGGILDPQNFAFWILMFGFYLFLMKGVPDIAFAVASVPALLFAIQLMNEYIFVAADEQIRFRSTIYVLLALFAMTNPQVKTSFMKNPLCNRIILALKAQVRRKSLN